MNNLSKTKEILFATNLISCAIFLAHSASADQQTIYRIENPFNIALGNPKSEIKLAATISGSGGDDTLTGTTSPDKIKGDSGADIINGLGSKDYLYGDAGIDTMDGGTGGGDFCDSGTEPDIKADANPGDNDPGCDTYYE